MAEKNTKSILEAIKKKLSKFDHKEEIASVVTDESKSGQEPIPLDSLTQVKVSVPSDEFDYLSTSDKDDDREFTTEENSDLIQDDEFLVDDSTTHDNDDDLNSESGEENNLLSNDYSLDDENDLSENSLNEEIIKDDESLEIDIDEDFKLEDSDPKGDEVGFSAQDFEEEDGDFELEEDSKSKENEEPQDDLLDDGNELDDLHINKVEEDINIEDPSDNYSDNKSEYDLDHDFTDLDNEDNKNSNASHKEIQDIDEDLLFDDEENDLNKNERSYKEEFKDEDFSKYLEDMEDDKLSSTNFSSTNNNKINQDSSTLEALYEGSSFASQGNDLISQEVKNKIKNSVTTALAVKDSANKIGHLLTDPEFGELVNEMLELKITEWLNENLTRMVETILKDELSKILKR